MAIHRLAAAAALASVWAAPAMAAPELSGAIADHAVLQRGRPIVLTGTALAGEVVTATLAGRSVTARADRAGRFRASLPPLAAGGPYQLTVTARSGSLVVRDLLIGDVFLCSGQSNMEFPVERSQDAFGAFGSADDKLRLATVAKASTVAPQPRLARPISWTAADPATVAPFSAACYFMVQDLRRSAGVPVGAILSAWSGSRISSWIDEAGLRAAGMGREVEVLDLYRRDEVAGMRAAAADWEAWWRAQPGNRAGAEPWRPDAALDWKPVPRIGPFRTWNVAGMASYQGLVWFRQEVTLTAEQARAGGLLSLGVVDDADRTWINGKPVGGSSNAGLQRNYVIPAGTLVAGRNVITVSADNNYMDGGLVGPADVMKLGLADGTDVPLSDGWSYAPGGPVRTGPPRAPWDDIRGAGTLYNAMIAPLGPVALAGVAWYQGESDVDIAHYDLRLRAMMDGWRKQFGVGDLPFAIVQLPDFGAFATQPVESGWATLRDEQRRAVEADGRAALAVTIDIGDPLDLHPPQKREVGRRLARAMRAMAYHDAASRSGPRIVSASRDAKGIVLRFADVTGSLATRSSGSAIGFELCGNEAGSCRYADARAGGDSVTLAADGRPVTRVRYAWANSPAVNLTDDAQLPVGPFEITIP